MASLGLKAKLYSSSRRVRLTTISSGTNIILPDDRNRGDHSYDANENVINSPTCLSIINLPLELLEKIFGYLSYENTSKIRLVCKRFDAIGSSILNSTFQRLQTTMLQRFQKIKAQMPRRESARRKHPLARESDIVETLHMRLTLLQMSFGKRIERKHCCFFAGEILDEVYRIINYIKTTPNLGRAYKVTDELFDLSTMAMEYFKEHIEPTLPEITYFSSDFLDFNSFSSGSSGKPFSWSTSTALSTAATASSSNASPCPSTSGSSNDGVPSPSNNGNNVLHSMNNNANNANTTTLKKKLHKFQHVMKRYNKKQSGMVRDMKRTRGQVSDQEKQIKDLSNRLEEFNKKAEESSCKYNAILQELNKCKTELQYWRSKSPAAQVCCLCSKNMGGGMPGGDVVDVMVNVGNGSDLVFVAPGEDVISSFAAAVSGGFKDVGNGGGNSVVVKTVSDRQSTSVSTSPGLTATPSTSSDFQVIPRIRDDVGDQHVSNFIPIPDCTATPSGASSGAGRVNMKKRKWSADKEDFDGADGQVLLSPLLLPSSAKMTKKYDDDDEYEAINEGDTEVARISAGAVTSSFTPGDAP